MKLISKLLIITLLLLFTTNLTAQHSKINVLKSAILPGWGEISMGNNTGYAFIASEILLWSAQLYFAQESDLKISAAHDYAYRYADVDPQGNYSQDFWIDLKNYDSYGFETGGYNANIILQAESIEDPEERQQFIDEHIYSESHFWKWESDERQHDYKILQKRSLEFDDYAKVFSGAIVANHIISVINSLRISALQTEVDVKVKVNKQLNPLLTFNYRF
ncbi:MAG: hypothetical protein PWQ09_736 [Candidatus Cloacimonadota bacterium]|jgi:hypothetical protein|nr:hypothetical protein [Candidatus Cloacimonadota bacterium]